MVEEKSLDIIRKYSDLLTLDSLIPPWLFIILGVGSILGYFLSIEFLRLSLSHKLFWLSFFWVILFSAILILEFRFIRHKTKNIFTLMKHKEISLLLLTDFLSTLFNIFLILFFLKQGSPAYIFPLIFLSYGIFGLIVG